MKKNRRKITLPTVIEVLLCMAAMCVTYPFHAFFLRAMAKLPYEEYIWSYVLLAECVGLFAYFIAAVSPLIFKRQWMATVLYYFTLAVTAVFSFLWNKNLTVPTALAVVSSMAMVALAILGYHLREGRFSKAVFAVETALYVAVPIIFGAFHYSYDMTSALVLYLLFAGIFAISENNKNLEFVMRRRGHQMTEMPGRIRTFNLLLLCVMFLLVLVLILFRGIAADFFIGFLLAGARVLNRVINFIAGFFPKNNGEAMEDMSPNLDLPNFAEEAASKGNGSVLTFITVCFFILAVIVFRKQIQKFLVAVARKIVAKIRAWFNRGLSRDLTDTDDNEYYTDENETISEDGMAGLLSHGKAMRQWKKELHRFEKMEDGEEKFRFGYSLSVKGLQLHGIRLEPDTTALELLEKSREIFTGQAYDVATSCRNAMRYSDRKVIPATAELSQALSTLKSRKERKIK